MLTNKKNSVPHHPVNKHISNIFIVTKCTTIINPIKKILKALIHKNILPTDPNKKIKLVIIYYNKFKTSNLGIRNNSTPLIGVLQKTNVIHKFKCPLGDCISDNNNIYVETAIKASTPSLPLKFPSDPKWKYLLGSHLWPRYNCLILYDTWNNLSVCKQLFFLVLDNTWNYLMNGVKLPMMVRFTC